MALFSVNEDKLVRVAQSKFPKERDLQRLVETNLSVVFNFRFVATEFATGAQHAGRIDTLALSEDDNPVIIEYKNVESSELITQSLYYLSWIGDHRGDFEVAVNKVLGPKTKVDWSDVRVICIAPNFRKFDVHAAQQIGAHMELWTYRLYENESLHLDQVFPKGQAAEIPTVSGKNPVMVAAGKKAALSKKTGSYTFDQHIDGKSPHIREIVTATHDAITALDPSIEVAPKKFYVAYKTTENIVCMEVKEKKVVLYLKLNPKKVALPKGISRDVSTIGHYGTGDVELALNSLSDLEASKPLLEQAYLEIGG